MGVADANKLLGTGPKTVDDLVKEHDAEVERKKAEKTAEEIKKTIEVVKPKPKVDAAKKAEELQAKV